MRGVAGKDHAAVEKSIHPPALEFVERDPFEIELVVAEHTCDPRPHILRTLLDHGVGVRMKLQVDAPDIVRLLVQQRRPPGMERRIEPEPALGRKRRGHLDVGDQELVLEHLPCEFRTDHLPQRGARAVAGDDKIRAAADTDRPASRSSAAHDRCAVPARSPCCASAGRWRQAPRRDRRDRLRHRIAAG